MTGAVFLDRHVDAAAVRAEVRDHVHVDFGMLGVDAVERQHAERPESFVERDGKRLRVELARLARRKGK